MQQRASAVEGGTLCSIADIISGVADIREITVNTRRER